MKKKTFTVPYGFRKILILLLFGYQYFLMKTLSLFNDFVIKSHKNCFLKSWCEMQVLNFKEENNSSLNELN